LLGKGNNHGNGAIPLPNDDPFPAVHTASRMQTRLVRDQDIGGFEPEPPSEGRRGLFASYAGGLGTAVPIWRIIMLRRP
jgi:hypothetical protein